MYDNFNDRKLFLKSLTNDEKQQLQEVKTFQNSRNERDKLFINLNKCPHCGCQIWND